MTRMLLSSTRTCNTMSLRLRPSGWSHGLGMVCRRGILKVANRFDEVFSEQISSGVCLKDTIDRAQAGSGHAITNGTLVFYFVKR